MKLPTVAAAIVFSFASVGVQAPPRTARGTTALDLRCLLLERLSCGCSLKVVTLACDASDPSGWKAHFFSEVNQGALLWINLGGREVSLRSRRPTTNSFLHGKGDRWVEEYDGENLKAVIRYRPGKSTCPAEKERDDGCEYFDVAADVAISVAGSREHTYRAIGECGC
jgi:hypothetical protein